MPLLNWVWKEAIVNHHKEVFLWLIRKIKYVSVGDDLWNLIVHRDNLEEVGRFKRTLK